MVPGGRLVAHGQMDESELEPTMLTFSNGEADILVCTIIESGLDIPRVNTILIEDSHLVYLSCTSCGVESVVLEFKLMLGCLPKQRMLTDTARQRYGDSRIHPAWSGYQLATRDMEIRGVGNLLG